MTVTNSHGGPSSRPKSKGKGKQVKHFLDSQSAVSLATQIADQQEAKTIIKADRKHHSAQAAVSSQPKKYSVSKLRLKEKKAAIIADRAKQKKAKAQLKKKDSQPASSGPARKNDDGGSATPAPRRKRVSFA
ncbi:hypothetical protein BDZ89DRAFT_131272 [Hymenopellis radicata]|nr:hypothetical protein BDZ89DRAFT_131272 [Hymenopellis radicata]